MAKTTWQIDAAHSTAVFKVRHLVISTVIGKFTSLHSTVTTDGDDVSTAEVEFAIDATSIDTGIPDRDAHLRSNDFFNAEAFPQIRFKSTKLEKVDDENYKVTGDLTIRDITKSITVDVEYGGIVKDPWGNIKAGFDARGKLNRKDFGLQWNAVTEAGGVVVADEVKFEVNVEYAKA